MLSIIKAGIQTSLQDLGRRGFSDQGITQGGALDTHALSMANILVGNPANSCAIELAVGPFEVEFLQPTQIAICGHGFKLLLSKYKSQHKSISKTDIACNWAYNLPAHTHLSIRNTQQSGRLYLAVAGGLLADNVFGSSSTDLYAKFGGHHGRCLQNGDQIALNTGANSQNNHQSQTPKPIVGAKLTLPNFKLRAIPTDEYHLFSSSCHNTFWQTRWQLSGDSNRMGGKLVGNALTDIQIKTELRSHAVLPGTVQIPPNGQPVVLLADVQVTGGYPKIATVISADLWQFAQMPSGSFFQFEMCDSEQAIKALHRQQQTLYQLALARTNITNKHH